MASASTPSANEPAKDLTLVHTVQLKPMIKSTFLSSGINDVVFASVYSEKIRLKKLMMKMIIIIIIMNKSKETTVFSGHQKMTSTMKVRSEKW